MARTRLEAELQRQGIRPAAFARTIGRPRQTVHGWLTGRRTPPLPDAKEVAQRLGTTVDDLW